jgi:hypothetical protein
LVDEVSLQEIDAGEKQVISVAAAPAATDVANKTSPNGRVQGTPLILISPQFNNQRRSNVAELNSTASFVCDVVIFATRKSFGTAAQACLLSRGSHTRPIESLA